MRAFFGALLALCLFGIQAPKARAVDETGIKIAEKWSVVGVIAEDDGTGVKGKGIAVIRNNLSKRTFTLAIGDSVPSEFGYVLKAVKSKSVVIANDKQAVTLAYADGTTGPAEEEGGLTPTSRFLDNYYRGLSESPIEILGPGSEGEPEKADGPQTTILPLKRFGTLKSDGRSRFDLYRADRTYRMNAEVEDDTSTLDGGDNGFVVNYDNFDDVTSGEEATTFGPPDEVPPLPIE